MLCRVRALRILCANLQPPSTVKTRLRSIAAVALSVPFASAAKVKDMPNPDFTKGETIPAGATHDWNLGATGARGWIHSDKLTTSGARQIYITKVDKGSPADGVLATGDVILGTGGKAFSYDPRTEFGKALTIAESDAGGGKLALTRWRAGKTGEIVVKLPVLGTYSATAPFDCQKSARILKNGCKALAGRMEQPAYPKSQSPVTRSLNALALLAGGDPSHLPLVKREAAWAAEFSVESMATWYYGYVIMLLAEYHMATGDESVVPGMRRLAMEAAEGQSIVGSWGHKFAGPDGRLVGYGMMNAPGVPLTTSLVMARAAGVKDKEVADAIERSARLLRFYIGKGAVPYGDHTPWIQTHEDNGKCGMASVLFNLMGEDKGAEYFSRMSLASHGAERDCGHTGNFWNITWSMPAVAQSGPHAAGAWMSEFGAWYFDLARCWDGSFPHQGPPEAAPDHTGKWDATGTYLLAYAMPLKKIHLTGKRPATTPPLDAATAASIIADGRGWSNIDRNSHYDALDENELMKRLASWSPVVRERAAMALSRRKGSARIKPLVSMLDSPSVEARLGACQALVMFKTEAAPAIPALRANLRHDDLWLRIKAAEAIAATGDAGMAVLPELLERLAQGPTAADPRGMEQRFLTFTVFGTMLTKSPDGVDPTLLRTAITAGLKNQDGRSRGVIGGIYGKLSYEQIKPLLPAIHEAIVTPSPSGIMFADGVRLAGLKLLANLRIKEGIPLCLSLMDIERWNKKTRITACLDALTEYGPAAKPMLPQLRQLEKDLQAHSEGKSLKEQIEQLRALTRNIESATGSVELRSIR
jgi:hypothetical protein